VQSYGGQTADFRAAALRIVCYSFQFPFSEKAMRRDRGCAKMARLD